jgi:lipopolysaccharide/colanic/teichoic acid biosynthesis glycosyltransferase
VSPSLIKPVCDVLLALFALLLALPLLLVCMLLILCLDQHPALFLQPRLGLGKKPFIIFKLRTMKQGQVTPLGRILRKTGIDELPQLLNIIFLHMSFVGPRPLTQADITRLGWDDAWHAQRWQVRPGIAGLAQLAPICHKKVSWALDKKYLSCRSLAMDLKILLATAAVLVVGKKQVSQWFYANRQ